MRVLLVGEFSGFHINLKRGLKAIGVDCTLAANGDAWKKIDGADFKLYTEPRNTVLSKTIHKIIEAYLRRRRLYGYDIVQIIDPRIFHSYIAIPMFKAIRKHNKKVFVSVPGDCFSEFEVYKAGKFKYSIFDDNPTLCKIYDGKTKASQRLKEQEEYIYNHVDGIIPILYEYAVGVRNRKNTLDTIPMPFDCSKVEYHPNIVKDRIVIFHGIIRETTKGSKYIREALKIIEERHPDEVEVVIDGRMPLNDYLKLLQRVNILVDQCKEQGYSMNALYGMAEGKIVMSGASEDSTKELKLAYCPVVHIEPNVDQIVHQLEYLISKKDSFVQMGETSRKFVEEYHDCKRIAQHYLDCWIREVEHT